MKILPLPLVHKPFLLNCGKPDSVSAAFVLLLARPELCCYKEQKGQQRRKRLSV